MFIFFATDECTFTVSPDPKAKIYLQSPNLPYGLPPYVSISWYVIVPSKQVARLGFSKDRMGIACETGRAYVNIKEQTPGAEEIVRREDELLPEPRNMHHNFWVNISNCKPVDSMQLTVQFWVTLAEKQIGEFWEFVVACFMLVSFLSIVGTIMHAALHALGFMRSLLSEMLDPSKPFGSYNGVLLATGEKGGFLMQWKFDFYS